LEVLCRHKKNFSTDFKEDYWEEIKKDPRKLGNIIKSVINTIAGVSKNRKTVFTDFQFIDKAKRFQFCFELYDVSDEEQRKTYLEKSDPKERERYKL